MKEIEPYRRFNMNIYCTGCQKNVEAWLVSGREVYPHRPDLADLPFWECENCDAFVGCHHKTNDPTRPLGVLATQEIKDARKKIHAVLDPLWKSGKIGRGQAYAYIKHRTGKEYHTAEIRSLEEARNIYSIVAKLHNELAAPSLA